jgi:hypothetical protein
MSLNPDHWYVSPQRCFYFDIAREAGRLDERGLPGKVVPVE